MRPQVPCLILFMLLIAATPKHGVSGQPAFLYLDVFRPFSVGSYGKLSDFSRFLDEVGQKQKIHLRATVHDVVPLTDFSGKVTLVDFDPKFALTVRIESVDPAVSGFAAGAVISFAIHSPALLFREDVTKGKTYDFSLEREIEHGKVRFFGLKVEKTKGSRQANARFIGSPSKSRTIDCTSPISAFIGT